MTNPVSLVRSWLGSTATPGRAAKHAPAQKNDAGRLPRQAGPELSSLTPRSPGRALPTITASPAPDRRAPACAPSDPELHEAIKAVRSAADWSLNASGPGSPRAGSEGGDGQAPIRADGPPGDGWGMAFLRKAEAEVREELLDMAWQHDFSSARMNEILAHAPDLVNAVGHHGETLLVSALGCSNFELAKVLIARGADVSACDSHGNTPLHLAAGHDAALMRQLLEAGADPRATNKRGATPLFSARSAEVVNLLAHAGTPVDLCDKNGNSAVMWLAQAAKRDTVLAMLAHNPDLGIRNKQGRTFARLLTARFGGMAHAIPKTAFAAKAFLELAKRETPLTGDLRDRKPLSSSAGTAGMRRPQAPPRSASDLRVGPELRLSPRNARAAGKPAINDLKSGHKINLVRDPLRTFDELNDRDVEAISEALGFGKLSTDHADTREQQRTAIRRTLAQFVKELNHDLEDYDNAALEHPALNYPLSPEERDELMEAMKVAHIWIAATRVPGGHFEKPLRLRLFFGGTQNLRDVRQDISSAFGRIADVDRAARRAGELFAKILSHPDHVQLDFLGGASMGGAMAQAFRATVESRVLLPKQPSMILMDPQLLNNNQARRATKGGAIDVDYSRPRGVALTLDHSKAPHRGLMGIMKGPGGYRYPGLVHIKLGLTDTDGEQGSRPKTSGPPGLGYHADPRQFVNALSRFSVDRHEAVLDDPAFDALRAPRWAPQQGPVRTSATLPAIARHGRRPMESIDEEDNPGT
ncbi:ankyrin repeat domain-containing protein (plasmid) [Ralstonia syzygii]|uniref:Ankyrin repeat domain-containing protein n=1 Tax=Ralstonia syzygii TaxID=28097 RepID=A0ABX7ZLN2_9RALS|nr:ankyrin repeat domain-containing protein [Ralstonia syzygii]QUP55892.1 ankyrin repeat domain-containing protein [Ralstonia syzygii]